MVILSEEAAKLNIYGLGLSSLSFVLLSKNK